MLSGILSALAATASLGLAASGSAMLSPTGVAVTPEAAPGAIFQSLNPDIKELPDFKAGQAAAMALSPDGKTLAILTSGFNRNRDAAGKVILAGASEYVFLYDVSGAAPVKIQVLRIPNSFQGIGWSVDGKRLFVSGGVNDNLTVFSRKEGGFAQTATISLNHKAGLGLKVQPEAAGLAVSPGGGRVLVTNLQNDSVSLIDTASLTVVDELDLRPGAHSPAAHGKSGGTFPRAAVFASERKAYVASQRDREVVVVRLGPKGKMGLMKRVRVPGQPDALVMNRARTRAYVALDNTDRVAVLDVASDRVIESFSTQAPAAILSNPLKLGGAGANALSLSPDEQTLLVSNGGENAVAVVKLSALATGAAHPAKAARDDDGDEDDKPVVDKSAVVGLIPTGWYPTAVAVRPDGKQIYVVNGKSDPGPNPGNCRGNPKMKKGECEGTNQYVWQLEKAGFLTLPAPDPATLGELTRQVAQNNRFMAAPTEEDRKTVAFLRQNIKHVIYIVKENRTYDQVLGDLEKGNGDPSLTLLGQAITPNHHDLARRFVTLDNFLDSGESSNTGWNWSVAARTTDFTEREAPVNYAARGLQYDQEGSNRNVNMAVATSDERRKLNPDSPADPDVLPGIKDVAAPDGPHGRIGQGYLWDAALSKGLWVRNYGFYEDLVRYREVGETNRIPLERDPFSKGLVVVFPSKASLIPVSDPYFRSFDQAFPDFWRFKEWKREYDQHVASGKAPALTLLRLNHDHFGDFKDAIDGVNTVETQMADNDYSIALVAEAVAKGPFAKDTLIFMIEDDAQDGADHVNAHRSIALIVGPYVKQGAVVSKRYTTVNVVRTMVDILGLEPLGLNDAMAEPMTEVFDINQSSWTYKPLVPSVLRSTGLPLPPEEHACVAQPGRSAAWWEAAMKGQDFSAEDRLDTARFNRVLWQGLKGVKGPASVCN
jgi:YVTN family beta-propeller protein